MFFVSFFIASCYCFVVLFFFFFFNDTATTEIYTLSLHDALPISCPCWPSATGSCDRTSVDTRSEEHTSELQSRQYLVCRLLLEKKKKKQLHNNITKKKTKKTDRTKKTTKK